MIAQTFCKANAIYWLKTIKNKTKWSLLFVTAEVYFLLRARYNFLVNIYKSCTSQFFWYLCRRVGFPSPHGRKWSVTRTCSHRWCYQNSQRYLNIFEAFKVFNSVDKMLSGWRLVSYNQYASHKSSTATKTLEFLRKV